MHLNKIKVPLSQTMPQISLKGYYPNFHRHLSNLVLLLLLLQLLCLKRQRKRKKKRLFESQKEGIITSKNWCSVQQLPVQSLKKPYKKSLVHAMLHYATTNDTFAIHLYAIPQFKTTYHLPDETLTQRFNITHLQTTLWVIKTSTKQCATFSSFTQLLCHKWA